MSGWTLYGLRQQTIATDDVIGRSCAVREGDHVRIADGFIKDQCGILIGIKKQHKRALMEFGFIGPPPGGMDFDL